MSTSTFNSQYSSSSSTFARTKASAIVAAITSFPLRLITLIAVAIPAISVAESVSTIRNANLDGVGRDKFEFTYQPPTNSKYAYITYGEALWRTDGVNTKKLDFSNSRMGDPGTVVALNESVVYFQFNGNGNAGPVALWRADVGREHKVVRALRLSPSGIDDRISIETPNTLDGEFVFEVNRYKNSTPRSIRRLSVLATKDQGRRLPRQPIFRSRYTDYTFGPRLSVINNRLFIIENLRNLWMFESEMSTPRLLTVRQDAFLFPYSSSIQQSGGYDSIYGSNQHVYLSTPEFNGSTRPKSCELWRNDGTGRGNVSIDFLENNSDFSGEYPCARIVAQVDDQIFYYRGLGAGDAPMELWTAKDNASGKRRLLTGLAPRALNHKRQSRFDAENSKLWIIVRKINQGNGVISQELLSMNKDGTDLRVHFETAERNLAFGPLTSSGPTFVAQDNNTLQTNYYSIDAVTGDLQKFHTDKGRQPILTELNDKVIYFATTPRKRGALHSYDPGSGRIRLIHRFPRVR